VLTISANRQWDRKEDDDVLAAERPHGSFTRRVLLGEGLDTSKLEASYDHGVLTVTVPVAEQAQPRKIAIGGGRRPEAIEATTSNN
jgi:HSP20 family protein